MVTWLHVVSVTQDKPSKFLDPWIYSKVQTTHTKARLHLLLPPTQAA